MGLEFDYNDRDTPHHNYLDEICFETIDNRGRYIIYAANIPTKLRYKQFNAAFKTIKLMYELDVIYIS